MYTCAYVPSKLTCFNVTNDGKLGLVHEIIYSPNKDTTKISQVSIPNHEYYTELYFMNEDFAVNGPKIKRTVPKYNLWDKILNKLFDKEIKLCEYTYYFDFIRAQLTEATCDSSLVYRLPEYFTDAKIHIKFADHTVRTADLVYVDIDRVEFDKLINTYRICIFCNGQITVIKFYGNDAITTVNLSGNDKNCDNLEEIKNV